MRGGEHSSPGMDRGECAEVQKVPNDVIAPMAREVNNNEESEPIPIHTLLQHPTGFLDRCDGKHSAMTDPYMDGAGMDTEPATGSTEDMMAGHKDSSIPDGCPEG